MSLDLLTYGATFAIGLGLGYALGVKHLLIDAEERLQLAIATMRADIAGELRRLASNIAPPKP